ncbi:hypothetical protein FP2506_12339 [Fulvimarina pelagi HTCC2506]|uniref:Uncharacterized protein n=1 Tax=Fulvimarina pelagi HTCC2506 TaxID=314231 RepID=Q0G1M8_9HYPH|nr:hypothetical protein FP2506_12339 [Fulvimarina pelagi HTCC2506]
MLLLELPCGMIFSVEDSRSLRIVNGAAIRL